LIVLWYICFAQEIIIKSMNQRLVCPDPITSDFLCLSQWNILKWNFKRSFDRAYIP